MNDPPSPHEALFSKLPSGPSAISSEEVASHQRTRLMGAMVEASWRHGFASTTLKELVGLAGVSNSAFYRHFDNREDCFLQAFDEIVLRVTERVSTAYASGDNPHDRLRAAFDAYVDFAIDDRAAAYLVFVDSLSLESAGVARRLQAVASFEQAFRRSFDESPERGEVSDTTIRAIVGGIQRFVFNSVRGKEGYDLRALVPKLLDWGLSYQQPGGARALERAGIAISGDLSELPAPKHQIWKEPPNSPESRGNLSQRERIVKGVAMAAAENGYSNLTIPAITAAAGVSNQTFYETFTGKDEAFMEALDLLGELATRQLLEVQMPASSWVDSMISRLEVLLRFTAENPGLARLPYIEVLSAGSTGVAHVGMLIDRLSLLFEPEDTDVPDYVVDAVAGGIYTVVQQQIAVRETETLLEMLPDLAFIALAPIVLDPQP